jgi:hypothetical protein
MAFKTFAPGVLTSSDVNTFLMRQAVITCTSSTRPASPNEGMTIYETDTDLTLQYSGTAWEVVTHIGAWETYTPVINDWTLGNGTMTGRYQRVGRLVVVQIRVTWGSTSTFVGALRFGMPVNVVATTLTSEAMGYCKSRDVSAGIDYPGFIRRSGNQIVPDWGVTNIGASLRSDNIKNNEPFTWTTNDELSITAIYEAAS